jgi:hypothetical protein
MSKGKSDKIRRYVKYQKRPSGWTKTTNYETAPFRGLPTSHHLWWWLLTERRI